MFSIVGLQLICYSSVWSIYPYLEVSWWLHQMETFSALLALCAGNSPVTGEFPSQRPVTRRFDVCFDLRLNKRLSKQTWGWWLETSSALLWRHAIFVHWHEGNHRSNLMPVKQPYRIWVKLFKTEPPTFTIRRGSHAKSLKAYFTCIDSFVAV